MARGEGWLALLAVGTVGTVFVVLARREEKKAAWERAIRAPGEKEARRLERKSKHLAKKLDRIR